MFTRWRMCCSGKKEKKEKKEKREKKDKGRPSSRDGGGAAAGGGAAQTEEERAAALLETRDEEGLHSSQARLKVVSLEEMAGSTTR